MKSALEEVNAIASEWKMPMLIQGLLRIDSLVQSTNAWDWVTARLVSEEGGQMKVCM